MMAAITGFPLAPPVGLAITIGAVQATSVDTGYSNHGAWGYYGTMSPANSRVTPNAAPDANAADRIIRCVWEITDTLAIGAAGGLGSIPFSAIIIDGVKYPGDVAGFWTLSGGFPTIFNFSLPTGYPNPLAPGNHTVIFI